MKYLIVILALLLLMFPASAGTIIGNWTFDQSGAFLNDSSGYNNNGSISGAAWDSDSVSGSTLYFDGVNDKVTIPTSSSLNYTNNTPFTITTWARVYNYSSSGNIINRIRDTFTGIQIRVDGRINVWGNISGATNNMVGNGVVPLYTWTHLTYNFNGSCGLLYINNVLDYSRCGDVKHNGDSTNDILIGNSSGYFNGTIDEMHLYNYSLNATEMTDDYEQYQPVLAYPPRGFAIPSPYPPLVSSVNFSWHDTEHSQNAIMVAEDTGYSLLSVDTATANEFHLATLVAGKKYYWKVAEYSGGAASNWSETRNFTIASTSSATGIGIEGVVFELIGGNPTTISGATVYLYNNTISMSMVTGSNGYYYFPGLVNMTTYNIYASKQGYDTTPVLPVTTGNGTVSTNNILMNLYISPYVPNFVFEKFVVQGIFDDPYPGVTVTVYKDDDLVAELSGMTDSLGQVVFQMIKDQYYRVVFSGGGIGSDITTYVYGKDETYYLRILTGFPSGGDRYSDISTNLTPIFINATFSNLSLIYNDTKLSTSSLWFYVKNESSGVTRYSYIASTNVITLGFADFSTGTYIIGFNATSSIYGTFQEALVIRFGAGTQAASVLNGKADRTLLQWGSIALLIFIAALFGAKSVKYGAIILPFSAFVLWMPPLSTFEPIVGGSALTNFVLLACSLVIGIMVYMRLSENKAVVDV